MDGQSAVVFWFRRDLRLEDNLGLWESLNYARQRHSTVIPLFIFDQTILNHLEPTDARVYFVYTQIQRIHHQLQQYSSGLLVRHGSVPEVFKTLCAERNIRAVFCNHDYEPTAIQRDNAVQQFLVHCGSQFFSYKDQVIAEKDEILNRQGKPFTVFTPYSRVWKEYLAQHPLHHYGSESQLDYFWKTTPQPLPDLRGIGFIPRPDILFPSRDLVEATIKNYHNTRDIPGLQGTSRLSVHLRFGTLSIRWLVAKALELNEKWLTEIIWREFFQQILWFFPHVVTRNFYEKFEGLPWRSGVEAEQDFERWRSGNTGYPLVDAGMRELNATGWMHNRVRMLCASFFCKHLLLDWRWGEAYFARKLLDYELASNNGNWQWAAGTGCDAAPYFRIFNPHIQQQKFDPDNEYIHRWIPEYATNAYPAPIIEHHYARERTLQVFREHLKK